MEYGRITLSDTGNSYRIQVTRIKWQALYIDYFQVEKTKKVSESVNISVGFFGRVFMSNRNKRLNAANGTSNNYELSQQ